MNIGKYCSHCKRTLPVTNGFFHRNRSTGDGFADCCKECSNKYALKWKKKNLTKVRETNRICRFERKFGISIEQRDALVKAQEGRCAWCREPLPHAGSLSRGCHLDHCHETGMIRGIVHAR